MRTFSKDVESRVTYNKSITGKKGQLSSGYDGASQSDTKTGDNMSKYEDRMLNKISNQA